MKNKRDGTQNYFVSSRGEEEIPSLKNIYDDKNDKFAAFSREVD